jgi:pre-mRNA-splicing helicase BRR2
MLTALGGFSKHRDPVTNTFDVYANSIQTFNNIQTRVFQASYTSDDNVFIGAQTGSGKMICAEFAPRRLWSKSESLRAVCIEPYPEMVDLRGRNGRRSLEVCRMGRRF